MNRFAELLDRLAYEPARNAKLRLITDYFRTTPDPERGWALAALTGALTFRHAKAGMIRALIAERTDPVLFALSYDYVGDLSETVALMWPSDADASAKRVPDASPTSSRRSTTLGKAQLPAQLARWLDGLDETGRWALLKLVTGALRIGVSARLAKTALAALGGEGAGRDRDWSGTGLAPPYTRAVRLARRPRATSRRPPIRRRSGRRCWRTRSRKPISPRSIAADFTAEWKWDGIRVQAVAGADEHGATSRGFIRAPARISPRAFPISSTRCACRRAIDGELLIMRDRPRAVLQRAAAAAQPQSRDAEAASPNSRRTCAPTTCSPTATRICATCPSPSGARGSKRFVARLDASAHRPLAAGAVRRPGTN